MRTKEALVRARVDLQLKRKSESILQRLGISTTEAIRMFLTQVTLQKGLPFRVSLEPEGMDPLLRTARKRQAALDSVYGD